jgi:hypothetical protein
MKTIKDNAKFDRPHIEMIRAIIAFCLSTAVIAITQSIPKFFQFITRLKNNLISIDNLEQLASNPVTGIAGLKKTLRNALTEMSVAVMQTVYAYATDPDVNNTVLAAQMKISRDQLNKMSYKDFMAFIGQAITNVNGVIDQLAEFNITPELTATWLANHTQLKNMLADPKTAHDNIDAIKNDIQDLLRASMILLYNQCDTVALQFKKDNINYYRQYRSARKLQPLSKHTKFRVHITDEDGNPQYNVPVSQNNTANSTSTDINGDATLYIITHKTKGAQPVYEFTLGNPPQSIHTDPLEIKKGHTLTMNFIMQPSGFIIPAPQDETTAANS